MKTASAQSLSLQGTASRSLLTILMIGVGVALPRGFHALGLGSVFLPMFLPALLAAMTIDLPYALIVAVVTPVLSSLIAGVPSAGMAVVMGVQLAVACMTVWLVYERKKRSVWLALLAGIVTERLLSLILASTLLNGILTPSGVLASYPGMIFLFVSGFLLMKFYER